MACLLLLYRDAGTGFIICSLRRQNKIFKIVSAVLASWWLALKAGYEMY